MKKIILTLVGGLFILASTAQEITPYMAYQIKKNVEVEVLETNRVEKYGWDNLEIKYKLTNNSDYDLKKYDFMIHLIDKNGYEIGTINAFAFGIKKKSINELHYIETMSPYANKPIDQCISETYQMDIILDDEDNQLVYIDNVRSVK